MLQFDFCHSKNATQLPIKRLYKPKTMSMRIFIGLITAILTFCCGTKAWAQMGSVFYGERNLEMDQSALFLDKDGWWYPAIRIEDDSLRKVGNLKNWYASHPVDFEYLSKLYGCTFSGWSEKNAHILNDSIRQNRIQFWSKPGANRLTFLVHGFRKTFRPLPYERDSPNDYQILKKALMASGAETGPMVEVYWDGLYGCCFSASPSQNRPLFQLFETASVHAEAAGRALGIFLAGLQSKQIGLISHSLGAKVLLHAVAEPVWKSVPDKELRLCLIGPAIGPDLVLKLLKKRTDAGDQNRIRLDLVYNEGDFVLRKKDPKLGWFGPGPKKYGDTRLGCNARNATVKLKEKVNQLFPGIEIQVHNAKDVGACHHIWCYTRNGLMEAVFKASLGVNP